MAVTDISEAARVRARGALVELAGAEFRLRFDWDALERLEAEFGSVVTFERAKNSALRRGQGPLLRVLRICFSTGLEPPISAEMVKQMLDQERRDGNLTKLLQAVHDAWLEAWPAAEEQTGKGEGEESGSPSPISSSGSQLTSAAHKKSSGE